MQAKHQYLERLGPWIFTAFLIVLWQLVAPLSGLPPIVLPTPLQILARAQEASGQLLNSTMLTLMEVMYGFAAAVMFGILLALGVFYSRTVEKTIYPLLVAFQTIPKVALAPLLVLWFGFGLEPKIVIGFLTAFFPIVISTVVGLRSLDEGMVHLVRSMGASETQTFLKVRLPAALPSIFGGLKIGIGLAVIGAIIGEYVASNGGLGYIQVTAGSQFDSALSFAALFAIAFIGIGTFYAVRLFEWIFVRSPGS